MAASTPSEAVAVMVERFNPGAAAGVDAVLQFDLSGDDGGRWAFKIANGAVEVVEGGVDAPTTTLSMTTETFVGLNNGTVNGMTAFMMGKIKLAGDMGIAMKFQNMFPVS